MTAGRAFVVGLVAAALGVVGGPRIAGAVTVTTDAELTAAWIDPAVEEIVLDADLDLGCAPRTRPAGPEVVLRGQGHTLTDVCPDDMGFTFGTLGPVALTDVRIVGRATGSTRLVLGAGEAVRIVDAELVVRATAEEALVVGSGSEVVGSTIELVGGQGAIATIDATSLLVEDSTITGAGSGISASSVDDLTVAGLVVRDSLVATATAALSSGLPTRIERSSFRSGYEGSTLRSTATVTDSTFVADPDLREPPLPLSAALRVFDGGDVTLAGSTLVAQGGADDVAEALRVEPGARVAVVGSALAAGPGADVCRGGTRVTSLGFNVAGDATCGLDGEGDQVADPALPPVDPATGAAVPPATSPVIDAVPAAACRSAVDQLGAPRPSGAECDAGAVERQVVDPTPTSTPTTSTLPTRPARPAVPVPGPARFTG